MNSLTEKGEGIFSSSPVSHWAKKCISLWLKNIQRRKTPHRTVTAAPSARPHWTLMIAEQGFWGLKEIFCEFTLPAHPSISLAFPPFSLALSFSLHYSCCGPTVPQGCKAQRILGKWPVNFIYMKCMSSSRICRLICTNLEMLHLHETYFLFMMLRFLTATYIRK